MLLVHTYTHIHILRMPLDSYTGHFILTILLTSPNYQLLLTVLLLPTPYSLFVYTYIGKHIHTPLESYNILNEPFHIKNALQAWSIDIDTDLTIPNFNRLIVNKYGNETVIL